MKKLQQQHTNKRSILNTHRVTAEVYKYIYRVVEFEQETF